MSSYLEPLYAALRTRIAATWPEVVANGIWEAEHTELIPWEDLTPPFAVIAAGRMTVGEWGGSNLVYDAPIDVYYIGAVSGPSSPIRAKLEALRDNLRTVELTTGQVIDIPELAWDLSVGPNSMFAEKGYNHRAGRVTLQTVVGETI